MSTNKTMDSYDDIKGMLNKVRKIQAISKLNTYGLIGEQEGMAGQGTASNANPNQAMGNPKNPNNTGDDMLVINNVEVEIHSEDPQDLQIEEDEKGKISQIIDDFRREVSEIAQFDKLDIYPDSAKLTGRIQEMNLTFTFSTGNDTGLYLSNTSLLKIDDNSLNMISKLRAFEQKFSNTINDLLLNRSSN